MGRSASAVIEIQCDRFTNNYMLLKNSNITDIGLYVQNLDLEEYSSGLLAKLREGKLEIQNCIFKNTGKMNKLKYYSYGGFVRATAALIFVNKTIFENFKNETVINARGFLDLHTNLITILNCCFKNNFVEEGAAIFWRNMQSAQKIKIQIIGSKFSNLKSSNNGIVIFQQGSFSLIDLIIKKSNFFDLVCDDIIQKSECLVFSIQKHTSSLIRWNVMMHTIQLKNIFANQLIQLVNHNTQLINVEYSLVEEQVKKQDSEGLGFFAI